jgi:hypothetical protein
MRGFKRLREEEGYCTLGGIKDGWRRLNVLFCCVIKWDRLIP